MKYIITALIGFIAGVVVGVIGIVLSGDMETWEADLDLNAPAKG